MKRIIICLFFGCMAINCLAQIEGEDQLETPHPWGTFPKRFVISPNLPFVMGDLNKRMHDQYIRGTIDEWNSNEYFLNTRIIDQIVDCVPGDENHEYTVGYNSAAGIDITKTCPSSLDGSWTEKNDRNEVHFNLWPSVAQLQGLLGFTKGRVNKTEFDVFINNKTIWNRDEDIYQCEIRDLKSYFINQTLLHELGHAIGLGHQPTGTDSVMTPSANGTTCGPSGYVTWRGFNKVTDLSKVYNQVRREDFRQLVDIYKTAFDFHFTLEIDISSPENDQHLYSGQSYTFSAANSGPAAYIAPTRTLSSNQTVSKPEAVSNLIWKWESDVDGLIGSSETIVVNDLTPGYHTITVTATNGKSGSLAELGEKSISIKVVSDGFYGDDSTNFFPNPCVRYVGDPNKGCLMYFTGGIAYPSDGSCNQFYTPSFTAKNLDTGKTFATTKFFGTSNCSANNRSDKFSWYFWLQDADDQAMVRGTYKVTAPGCTTFSDLCFSSTYHALIPIVSASITLEPTATSCELPGNATYCSVQISWSNGKHNNGAGLFYRENSQSPWIFVESTNRSHGTFSTPDIVDESGIQLAIFQFTEDTFGEPFTSPPKGRMTPIITVVGNRVPLPKFMGEDVFSFGGANEDKEKDSWDVLENGVTLNLYGNTWKAIDYDYEVNLNTWLEFEYRSDGPDSPEVAGVSLLTAASGTVNVEWENAFQADGIHRFGNQWFNRYFSNGWKKYDINVGHVMKYWSASERSVRQLGFIGDIDQSGKQIDISYRNPRLYQKSTNQLPEWGHSGNWYGKETNGQGIALEVNPINGMIVALWYTYAEDGHDKGASYNRTYLQSGAYGPTDREVPLTMYQTTGGRFNRSNTTTTKVVGTAKIRFFDCYNAHIEYDFSSGYNSGRKGYIPLTRITQNVDCKGQSQYLGPHKSEFGYTGNWYNPATEGQGFTFEVNPAQGVIVGQWFTYLPAHSSDLGNPNRQRVFSTVGPYTPGSPNSNELIIYQSTGGALDDPNPITTEAVGTASIEFHSCSSATIDYDFTGTQYFNGLSGSIDLVRITSNVTCE